MQVKPVLYTLQQSGSSFAAKGKSSAHLHKTGMNSNSTIDVVS